MENISKTLSFGKGNPPSALCKSSRRSAETGTEHRRGFSTSKLLLSIQMAALEFSPRRPNQRTLQWTKPHPSCKIRSTGLLMDVTGCILATFCIWALGAVVKSSSKVRVPAHDSVTGKTKQQSHLPLLTFAEHSLGARLRIWF